MRRSETSPPSLYATHRPSGERLGWKLSSVESEIDVLGPLPSNGVRITRRTPDHSSSPRKYFPSGDTASAYLSLWLDTTATGGAPPSAGTRYTSYDGVSFVKKTWRPSGAQTPRNAEPVVERVSCVSKARRPS